MEGRKNILASKEGRAKNRRTGSIIAAVIVLAAIIAGAWYVVSNDPANLVAEQLSLGNEYLSEAEYEQAIIAFTNTIDIDPNVKEAYLGLAEVYVAQKDYSSAKGILEQGYEITQNEELKATLEEVERTEKEYMEEVERAEEEARNAERIASLPVGTVEICEQIAAAYQNEDYIGACEMSNQLDRTGHFVTDEDEPVLIETANGMVGIYTYREYIVGIYCGDYRDGKREGKGILIRPERELPGYAIGEWKEDAPNGWQEVYQKGLWSRSVGNEVIASGYFVSEYSGNVGNGLWNGEVNIEETAHTERQVKSQEKFTAGFENGKLKVVDAIDGTMYTSYMIGIGSAYDSYKNIKDDKAEFLVDAEALERTYGISDLFGYGEEIFPDFRWNPNADWNGESWIYE